MVWLTDDMRLALFPAGFIARDPHHRASLTRREQENEVESVKSNTFAIPYFQKQTPLSSSGPIIFP